MYLEKELSEIVSIPSVTSNIIESKRCIDYCLNFVKKDINSDKLFVEQREFNGFHSMLISNCETMLFDILAVGHIDVVPATQELFVPKIDGTKMYGRGTADMKCGVLAALDILKDVIKLDKKIKYGVLIVSDEEIGGENGAKKWAELGLNAKVLLDYDSGKKFEYISQKSKGALCFEVETTGINAHGSRPWEGLDANDIMFEFIAELRKYFKSYSIENKPENVWVTTMHVGKIEGGDALNKISSKCKSLIDIRYTEDYKPEDIIKIFDDFKNRKNFFYKITTFAKNVFSDPNDKHWKRYFEILEKELGKKPVSSVFHGITDMRYFTNSNNIIIHHCPDIGEAHSDTEYVDLITLEKLKKVGLEFVLNYEQ